jgi:hypothetical protein
MKYSCPHRPFRSFPEWVGTGGNEWERVKFSMVAALREKPFTPGAAKPAVHIFSLAQRTPQTNELERTCKMTYGITRRTCANCAAFNASPKQDEPMCWNLIPIVAEEASSGHCDQHLTLNEDRFQTALIEEGRQSGGLPGAHAAMAAWIKGRALLSGVRLNK